MVAVHVVRPLLLAGLVFSAGALAADGPHEWLARMESALATRNYQGTFVHEHDGQTETLQVVHRAAGGEVRERIVSLDGSGREFLRRKGESAFSDWDRPANDTDKHAPGKPDRAGYRRACPGADGNDTQEFFVFNEAFRGVICKGYDPGAVGRLLVAKGFARKGTETDRPWLVRENLPTEGRARVVHVLPALFDSDDD